MIIDMHTHLMDYSQHMDMKLKEDIIRCGIDPSMYDFSEAEYLKGTDGADKVVVFGIRAKKTGWHVNNKFVYDFVGKHPQKYIYFASVDPLDDDCMEQLAFEYESRHCRGVKLGPIYQGLHPHDPLYYKIYEYCEKHHLTIITHMATTFSSGVPLEYARPAHMDKVACDFPGLNIVMAHLGHPWIEECVAAVRHQPNLYADISALYYRPWQFYQAMVLVKEYGIADKLFLGSDFPATTTLDTVGGLKEVNNIIEGTNLPRIPVDIIDNILYKDSLSILGIQ